MFLKLSYVVAGFKNFCYDLYTFYSAGLSYNYIKTLALIYIGQVT